MKAFMDKDFLLSTETSKKLFHEYAETMPIVDYHCHINPQEIAEDRKFENITQVWLGGDHYKWGQMRSNGVDEYYITGGASDREKFQKWAETLGKAIGNPLYHWSHLELQRYFGYTGYLNGDTAEEVWNLCNKKLQEDDMSVRNIIRKSNVKLICTTDDPVDDLKWHKVLAEDDSFEVKVLPAWRPDKAMNLEKPEYPEYMKKLSQVSGVEIADFADLKEALLKRMEFFAQMGCSVSDHALEYVMYAPAAEEKVNEKKDEGITTFINVGRHDEKQKKLTRIIEVAKRLKMNGYRFKMLWIGDGPDSNFYKEEIRKNKLQENIELLGRKQNPYPYFKISDCVILTSDYEGYPVVFLESFILNKPIITTKVSDYEQVEGKYGYVTDKSIEDIYEKMKLFIEKGFDIKQEFDANQYNSEIIKKLERIF